MNDVGQRRDTAAEECLIRVFVGRRVASRRSRRMASRSIPHSSFASVPSVYPSPSASESLSQHGHETQASKQERQIQGQRETGAVPRWAEYLVGGETSRFSSSSYGDRSSPARSVEPRNTSGCSWRHLQIPCGGLCVWDARKSKRRQPWYSRRDVANPLRDGLPR